MTPPSSSPSSVAGRVERALGVATGGSTELDGGEVGSVHRVALAGGRTVVAKIGSTPLSVEARMLRYLGARGLPVPAVEYASDALLVLEHVPGASGPAAVTPAVERDVARHLAALHGETADAYGFPFDTLSGPYRQANPWTDSWVEFFGEHRLLAAARAARDEGTLPPATCERVAAVRDDLDALVPDAPVPSLLHGDLWAGNLVVADDAVAAVLDPACYYGHAEIELSYARWAGFSETFLDAYDDAHPRGLAPGFDDRRPVYALLGILEHVRYFDADRYREDLDATLDAVGF